MKSELKHNENRTDRTFMKADYGSRAIRVGLVIGSCFDTVGKPEECFAVESSTCIQLDAA